MFIDIVFPKNNEKELITRARELSIKGLCFSYPYDHDFKQRATSIPHDKGVNVFCAGLLRSSIAMNGNIKMQGIKPEVFLTRSSKYNREVLDKASADIIFDYEAHPGPDSIAQRRSNFNHILARVAEKNGVVLGINLNTLLKCGKMNRQKYMGRIKQNLMLSRKYKCDYCIFSGASKPSEMRGPMDMLSLLESMAGFNFNRIQVQSTLHRLIKNE